MLPITLFRALQVSHLESSLKFKDSFQNVSLKLECALKNAFLGKRGEEL